MRKLSGLGENCRVSKEQERICQRSGLFLQPSAPYHPCLTLIHTQMIPRCANAAPCFLPDAFLLPIGGAPIAALPPLLLADAALSLIGAA